MNATVSKMILISLLCNGQERSDGILVCDQPDHPGYKFSKADLGVYRNESVNIL